MITIQKALQLGIQSLSTTPDPRLENEILLSEALKKPRSYLFSSPQALIEETIFQQYYQWIMRRKAGEPLAYILGHQEFWSLTFKVTPDTLIPRPDTEILVEQTLALLPAQQACRIVDLGTGSGCIALSIAHERPVWQIIAADISPAALSVAKENAQKLHLNNVEFCLTQWCKGLPDKKFTAILSNPPYVCALDPHLTQKELQHEPQNALISGMDGLQDLQAIILQARNYLEPGGWLILEHGYDQGQKVKNLLKQAGYSAIQTKKDYGSNDRVAIARYP